ncbi:hypothetical protein OHB00_47930 [Streptomyces sp. NBC_00631]|uniref:hypothetical protein n=1 Tax=Streptomyces sp. NBC_00631 TaxID=2975793 RepID=UPI0030E52414
MLLHTCSLELGDAALAASAADGRIVPLWVTAARLAEAGCSLESAVAAVHGHVAAGRRRGRRRWRRMR